MTADSPIVADDLTTDLLDPAGQIRSGGQSQDSRVATNETPDLPTLPSEPGAPAPQQTSPITPPVSSTVPQPHLPSGPQTIRVGSEEGMVASLAEAFEKAQGGDTIEIATDEPLLLDQQLYWNQAGSLHVRATAGKRPILVANHHLPKNIISFGRRPAVFASQDDSITLIGLTLVDLSAENRNVVFSDRSIKLVDVLCVTTSNRFLYVSENAPQATLERCYNWRRQTNDTVPQSLCTFNAKKVLISHCLFAGWASLIFMNNQHEVRCERTTFLGTQGAWQVSNQQMSLTAEKNLHVGLDWVVLFYDMAAGAEAARLAEARIRLPQYRGNTNGYFQCQRFASQISPKADADLAAWQAFTKNGEANPQFADPQFVRPDLIPLAQAKVLPPRAFVMKPASPPRRLKIGCDLSQVPEPPIRLDDVLPAELRFLGKI